MPVEKFESPREARRALWSDRQDVSLAERLRQLWSFTARLVPATTPRGVQRFRSIEEANRERDGRVAERARALRDRRRAPTERS